LAVIVHSIDCATLFREFSAAGRSLRSVAELHIILARSTKKARQVFAESAFYPIFMPGLTLPGGLTAKNLRRPLEGLAEILELIAKN
jgi:alkanesulfonate monooxygenase SsuD/methylene tetrahydromethanopterin reductase-like flavin-dependent oxidoreductase (luciferase family)